MKCISQFKKDQKKSAMNQVAQLRALNQIMDVMDAFDEEDRQAREATARRRSVWVKDWLLVRDNPRYKTDE